MNMTEDSGQCIASVTNDHASVSTIIAALQLELCDIHAVADHFAATTISFYTSPVTSEKCPSIAKLGLRVLGIFGYTYKFECMFSSMNHIKIVIEFVHQWASARFASSSHT